MEVQLYYSAAGTIYTKRDTEELDEWHHEIWNNIKWPKYVDVVIGPTNEYVIEAAADTGTINVSVEVKLEETKG